MNRTGIAAGRRRESARSCSSSTRPRSPARPRLETGWVVDTGCPQSRSVAGLMLARSDPRRRRHAVLREVRLGLGVLFGCMPQLRSDLFDPVPHGLIFSACGRGGLLRSGCRPVSGAAVGVCVRGAVPFSRLLSERVKSGHLWTPQIRPFRRPETGVEFYFTASCVCKVVWILVRQLRGPHFSTCA